MLFLFKPEQVFSVAIMGERVPQWWPWRPREMLLVIVGFVIVLILWNNAEKITIGQIWSHTWYSPRPQAVRVGTDNYTCQIDTYLEGRQKGLSQVQIAKEIFKVSNGCQNRHARLSKVDRKQPFYLQLTVITKFMQLSTPLYATLETYSSHFPTLLSFIALQVDFPDHGGGCPHSYPFVTGDTFRAFADVVFDNTEHYPLVSTNCCIY